MTCLPWLLTATDSLQEWQKGWNAQSRSYNSKCSANNKIKFNENSEFSEQQNEHSNRLATDTFHSDNKSGLPCCSVTDIFINVVNVRPHGWDHCCQTSSLREVKSQTFNTCNIHKTQNNLPWSNIWLVYLSLNLLVTSTTTLMIIKKWHLGLSEIKI